MATMIDSSVWVDYFHPKTPRAIRQTARGVILHADAALCEPILFELLRGAPKNQRAIIEAHFATMPVLHTPASLWRDARQLGQACHDRGMIAGSMDLLIASICIHHNVALVSFDAEFAEIAKVSSLECRLLARNA